MQRPILYVLVALGVLLNAADAIGRQPVRDPLDGAMPILSDHARDPGVLHGAVVNAAAKVDTFYLLGGPGRLDGKFEDASGAPAWHGWTAFDHTASDAIHWSVTQESALVISGLRSLWCGVEYPEPGPLPVPGFGYGNDWVQNLVFKHVVAQPGSNTSVGWSLLLQHDTEPGYDYVYLQWNEGGQWTTLAAFDGFAVQPFVVDLSFVARPQDLVGPGADEIQLRIRFESDGAWSDEDGLWPTSRGACQVDDLVVVIDGVTVSVTDVEDGTHPDWVATPDPGFGNFAAIYQNLGDLDPCVTNWSPQVAFIDDGVVVPGTGGTMCITWCYGPGGYIVNNSGGLGGDGYYINNVIQSPVLAWPPQADAAYFAFGVYRHEELGAFDVWPGIFYQWHVRSIVGDPADLETATWRNRNMVQYGGPQYVRHHEVISDLLHFNRSHIQVSLRVIQYGWIWGWVGIDGTPAPYFDNVAVVAYAQTGPSITARAIDLAQDGFPSNAQIDYQNLAANAVRFDMARNIALSTHLMNRPGDSLIVDVSAVRAGTDLTGPPTMHVAMRANPLFDGVRVLPPDFARIGSVISGVVPGSDTYNQSGILVPGRFNFDLPDDDFFYPGDVIHYYFRAEDTGGGVSTMPADLAGFGNFDDHLAWPNPFAVRALPSLDAASPGAQPQILFWNDGGPGDLNKWLFAIRNAGYADNAHYDLFQTTGASTGVGNGLGGRATAAHLERYSTILYRSADLALRTLSNGDFAHDPSDDLGLINTWLDLPPFHWSLKRSIMLTGDNLLSGLMMAGPAGEAFIADRVGVTVLSHDLRPFIQNQTSPVVRAIDGNGVIGSIPRWRVSGGCPRVATFDALLTAGAARLAEFTNIAGQHGVFPYAAATYKQHPVNQSRVVLMPYDLAAVEPPPGYIPPPWAVGKPVRSLILEDVLASFGHSFYHLTEAAVDAPLAVHTYPNPFNPSTTIRLTLPVASDVSVAVYNVRGELVRRLVDERLDAGRHDVPWDGRDQAGAAMASGVYFHQVRVGQETRVGKMLLMK